MKRLDLEEWYDLLAIELCNAVIKHDAERGSLANYFKLRADSLLYKEHKKRISAKRSGATVQYIDDITNDDSLGTVSDMLELDEFMDLENGDILRLKAQGYTQSEIADKLGVSQSYISKILKKLKKVYYETDR
jgi:DNA invertase Pin-like site-specific DNA recombinase